MNREQRIERLVEHMFRTATPGQELFSDMTVGPETEDTTFWILNTEGTVDVECDVVYPAMARVVGPSRKASIDEAKREIIALLLRGDASDTLVPSLEKRWGLVPG